MDCALESTSWAFSQSVSWMRALIHAHSKAHKTNSVQQFHYPNFISYHNPPASFCLPVNNGVYSPMLYNENFLYQVSQ